MLKGGGGGGGGGSVRTILKLVVVTMSALNKITGYPISQKDPRFLFEKRRGQSQEFWSLVSTIDGSTLPQDCYVWKESYAEHAVTGKTYNQEKHIKINPYYNRQTSFKPLTTEHNYSYSRTFMRLLWKPYAYLGENDCNQYDTKLSSE